MYTQHQTTAAEIAKKLGNFFLSPYDILTIAAAKNQANRDKEQSMTTEELAQRYVAECKRLRSTWKSILRQ